MNTTSRALLQTVLTTDASVSSVERDVVQRLIAGDTPTPPAQAGAGKPLLITQKAAAELLSVSRVTIWRMTKDALLHPVEILPGTWRYSYHEIVAFVSSAKRNQSDGREVVTRVA